MWSCKVNFYQPDLMLMISGKIEFFERMKCEKGLNCNVLVFWGGVPAKQVIYSPQIQGLPYDNVSFW